MKLMLPTLFLAFKVQVKRVGLFFSKKSYPQMSDVKNIITLGERYLLKWIDKCHQFLQYFNIVCNSVTGCQCGRKELYYVSGQAVSE